MPLPASALHWFQRVVATVGECIRDRFTGTLVVRFHFNAGGLRNVEAAREEVLALAQAEVQRMTMF